jgi:hypothetical protein
VVLDVINFLIHYPTNTTSPLYVGLNRAEVLTAQGGTAKVTLYDVNAQVGDTPYLKLYPSANVEPGPRLIGGSYEEWQILMIDCVAGGISSLQAQDRSENLRLETEGIIEGLTFSTSSGPLAKKVSVNNPNVSDSLAQWQIVTNSPQPVVTGQGREYVSTSTIQLKLLVFHSRRRAS